MALRVRRDHVPYDVWERQGYLQTTEGNVVHYGYIEKFIERLGELYHIREIAFDRWGAVQMTQNLEGMGFTVVPFAWLKKDGPLIIFFSAIQDWSSRRCTTTSTSWSPISAFPLPG